MHSLADQRLSVAAMRPGRMDWSVFVATFVLLGFGIVLVYSSSCALAQAKFGGADFFLARQVVRALIAVMCFMVFINVDYHVWGRLARPLFIAAIVLLVMAMVLPGVHAVKGARRWIHLGPLSFQASEFARLALVAALAQKIEELGEGIREWKKLAGLLGCIGLAAGLVFIEPNFSTALVIALIGIAMLFAGGANLWHLAGLAGAFVPVACIAMLSAPYRLKRVMGYLNMPEHRDGIGYQTYQAVLGLGNGGLFGRGIGQGEQKYFYLPEPHTDFAFSILGEEIGFIGLMIVLAVFVFILWRGMRIAQRAPDMLGRLMAFGFAFMIGLYVIIHASVNAGLIPTTGVPLPFLSYGGMSLAFTMSAVGILLNISSQVATRAQPLPWEKTRPARVRSALKKERPLWR